MKIITQFAVLSAVLMAAGCADQYRQSAYTPSGQVISSPRNSTTTTTSEYSNSSEGDRTLENRLRQSLQTGALSGISSGVRVSAQNGAVTLTGSVPTDTDRQAIDTLVRNTTGVSSVIDQLQISQPTATVAQNQAPPNSSYNNNSYANQQQNTMELDRALADRVRDAIRNNTSSGWLAQNINVSAQNGAVTLTGTIPNDQQRQVVDNLVRNVSGVTSVFDQMQIAATPTGRSDQQNYTYGQQSTSVAPQPPAATPAPMLTSGDIFNLHVQGLNDTDRNLAQNILQGLRTDTILHALLPTVNINVAGGRVILQGNVQSEQQRQAIASVVQRAAGANNVENQLQVTGQ